MNLNRHEIPAIFSAFPILMRVVWAVKFGLYPRVAVIYKHLRSLQFRGKRILDLGSGDGQFLDPIVLSRPNSIAVVDISASNLNFTKLLFPMVETHVQDVEIFLKQADSSKYDYVQCISTLQYLENPQVIIDNIRRVLAHEGRLLLYVPLNQFQEFFLYRWVFDRFSNYETRMNRKRIFSLGEIHQYLEIAGFEIESFTPTYGWFGRWSHELLSIGTILGSQSNLLLKLTGLIWLFHFIWVILILNILEYAFPPTESERFNGAVFVVKAGFTPGLK